MVVKVQLLDRLLPPITNPPDPVSGFSFDSVTHTITFTATYSHGVVGFYIYYILYTISVAQIASDLHTRSDWCKSMGLTITSYDMASLVIDIASKPLVISWNSCLKPAGKFNVFYSNLDFSEILNKRDIVSLVCITSHYNTLQRLQPVFKSSTEYKIGEYTVCVHENGFISVTSATRQNLKGTGKTCVQGVVQGVVLGVPGGVLFHPGLLSSVVDALSVLLQIEEAVKGMGSEWK